MLSQIINRLSYGSTFYFSNAKLTSASETVKLKIYRFLGIEWIMGRPGPPSHESFYSLSTSFYPFLPWEKQRCCSQFRSSPSKSISL